MFFIDWKEQQQQKTELKPHSESSGNASYLHQYNNEELVQISRW